MAYKRIQGITIEIGAKTTKLTDALKKTDSTLRSTQDKLRDVNKLLKLDPGNVELLTQKQQALQTAISTTEQRLKDLRSIQRDAVTPEQWDVLQREIADTDQQLRGLNQQMSEFGSVGAQQVAAAGEKVKAVGDKITDVGKAVMPASLAVIGLGAAAATKFAEVDKTMQLVNKTMGNTEEEAALLQKAMEEAASKSVFSMDDAATATLNFARAGLTAEEAAAALAPAMNLAAGEGGNLDTVSAGLVATINGFHDSFDQAGHYADVFAAACNNSALDVDSLSDSLSVAAPVFSAAGYTVEDAALFMGIMADNGIEANTAATSLKTGFARLVGPSGEAKEALKELDWSITNADGTMKDAVTIQSELHDKFADLSEAEQIAAASAIFGKNQFSPWLALINTAPEDVDELSASLTNCKGTTEEMATAMMSGFGGSIESLKSSLDVLMTSLGQLLSKYLQPLIDTLLSIVNWLNSLDEGTREIIVKVGLAIAALGPLLTVVGKVVSAVGSVMAFAPKIVTFMGTLKGLAATLGGGLQALWGIIAANPIGAIVVGIIGLIAIIKHLWDTSEDFRNFCTGLWENLKTGWETVINGIKEGWQSLVGKAKEIFDKIHDTVSKAVKKLKDLFNFKWELPKIKLPHFSIQGKFSLNPPQVPHLGVEWFRKAMEGGMILTSPTIFPAANGTLRGFGDAGPEAVVGVDSLRGMIAQAVAAATPVGLNEARDLTVVLQLEKTELGRVVYRLNNEEVQRVGVRLAPV